MARNNKYTVPYRRKREGKTNYRRRINILQGQTLRLVIRKSLKNINIQIVEYSPLGDKVIASANSKELLKKGWKADTSNLSAAYLTGFLLGTKAKKGTHAVVDIGSSPSIKGSILYAAVKGCIDAGVDIPCSESVFPANDRIEGKHVAEYAKLLSESKEKYNKQFSGYIKKGFAPEKFMEHYNEVKKKLGAQ